MFKHYLITRFNLKNPNWIHTKNNELLLDETWMEERFALFSNYCFPSVVNQTCQNFEWLLFFDSSTSAVFREKIAALVSSYSNIKIFYIDGMPVFYENILKVVHQPENNSAFLITSRIDNDDCIHKDFIATIQKQFNNQDFLALDFTKGYTLQIEPCFILGKKEHIFNPFITLIEKNESPKTVWHYDHNLWKKEPRIVHISSERLWMSIIHGKNKVNEFDGYGNVSWSAIANDFLTNKTTSATIAKLQLPYHKWWFKSLRNFIYVKMVLFSKQLKKFLGIYKFKS